MNDGDIAAAVREARRRIIEADPGCYPGFALDTAIRAVAKREGLDWRPVLRAYRDHYPAPEVTNWRRFSLGRRPTPEAAGLA